MFIISKFGNTVVGLNELREHLYLNYRDHENWYKVERALADADDEASRDDPDASEIAEVLHRIERLITNKRSDNRSVVAGNISGSTIITGNNSTVVR